MSPIPGMLAGHHYVFQPGADPAAPALLLLHGTGGTERDLLPLAQRLSPGSPLLSARGNVSERGAARFFRRFAEGVFDLADVGARTHALADFVAAAAATHGLDPARLIALGFSNGANIAATMLHLRPAALGGAILLRPMVVLDQAAPPGSLVGKRVLLASGTVDPLIPADHPDRLAELLAAGGAEIHRQTSVASHQLVSADFVAAQQFLAATL